ncbi:MAG: MarC family protein [Bacteroidetes bacterium]|nr:MarC family protein [Bacteroidota bacterium]MDA1121335.1 MarC family protein [Bacteroidota bacterium]
MFNFTEILSVTLILFSVIDILGSIPVIIKLRKEAGHIQSEKATIVSGLIMVIFLYLGEKILQLFSIDIESFAISGALIMFIIGMEMVLGRNFFQSDETNDTSSSIVPLAFPIIAGAGTMTSLLSLRAEFAMSNILVGVAINLVLIYIVLKTSGWLERKLGRAGFNIIRKVFGIILLSIAIKLFKTTLISIAASL